MWIALLYRVSTYAENNDLKVSNFKDKSWITITNLSLRFFNIIKPLCKLESGACLFGEWWAQLKWSMLSIQIFYSQIFLYKQKVLLKRKQQTRARKVAACLWKYLIQSTDKNLHGFMQQPKKKKSVFGMRMHIPFCTLSIHMFLSSFNSYGSCLLSIPQIKELLRRVC